MRFWECNDPTALSAQCPEEYTALLLQYDHFTVTVGDLKGILITYPWHTEKLPEGGRTAQVLLNPSPSHLSNSSESLRSTILRHPQAPAAVQKVIDQLNFVPATDFHIEQQ
ncbi:hypothetical protein [Bifidobacterium sp.]|uniref:hypothetical protein n=1 Tax=Bifidobacterium sp. TaxID=41200 RepID=UPI0039EAF5B4